MASLTTRAVPAARMLRPLLDWPDPMTVYVSYGRVWFPVFLAGLVCAVIVCRRRRPRGLERAGWWVFMIGVVAMMFFLAAGALPV